MILLKIYDCKCEIEIKLVIPQLVLVLMTFLKTVSPCLLVSIEKGMLN